MRFSYFWPFTHNIITQNTTQNNIKHLYMSHSRSTSIGNGKELDEQNNKKWYRKEGFSRSSKNITASNKKSTSRKELTSVSKITLWYLGKNIVILLLYRCALFIHTRMSKNSILSKDVISTSFDITWCTEPAIYAKNLLFSHSIDFYRILVNSKGNWWSKINKVWQSWMGWKTPL